MARGVLDFSSFHEADMVVEAVIEHVPLKQQIFEELERVCRPDCVLSSNTSTIDLDVCAAKMRQPERIVGKTLKDNRILIIEQMVD